MGIDKIVKQQPFDLDKRRSSKLDLITIDMFIKNKIPKKDKKLATSILLKKEIDTYKLGSYDNN